MTDERISPRFGPLVIKARMTSETSTLEGYLINVSVGGAFFTAEPPPPAGTEVELSAVMPWRLGELRARARVVWRNDPEAGDADIENRPSVAGAGLAFTELDPAAQEILDSYLARFAELAAEIEND